MWNIMFVEKIGAGINFIQWELIGCWKVIVMMRLAFVIQK